MDRRDHWNKVYAARDEPALTWFETRPELSLSLIAAHAAPGQAVVDVGAGASRLVDHLLEEGYGPLTVLDLSGAALDVARTRLAGAAGGVDWVAADVTQWRPTHRYHLWHDRAVFHFLTDPADRAAYVATLARALEPGGIAIIATFDLDGPETCSNLPVQRYDPAGLAAEIDRIAPGRFAPVGAQRHDHTTPLGRTQHFQVSVFRHDPVEDAASPA